MAKAKKQKNEEQKPDGGGSAGSGGFVVLHQKLCLSIDMERRMIHGYTEMKIDVQEGGNMALHAGNMTIVDISIDGEPADFECLPHYQVVEDQHRIGPVLSSKAAADVACSIYSSSLDKEMSPNLLIACNRSTKSNQQQCQENGRNIVQSCTNEQVVNGYNSLSEEKTVKLVRINYYIERPETGIHFMENVLHTNNQIRRAHCWFPCLDSNLQRCTFDLEFTVNSGYVAVSNGDLLYQVLSKDERPLKTFVYKLTTPVTAKWISLTVAPFEILPDSHNSIISHMCLSPSLPELKNTVGFFQSAFSHYEDYLSTSFPFGSYKQIFIPAEMTVSSMSLGASTCIFSSHLLFDDKVIDQTIDTRIKLAYALARQWFGVYITAEEPADEWLLDGLAGFLTDTYIKRFHGNNEARYRRYKANFAVCKADVSGATALSSAAATNDLYGTHIIGSYGKIRLWKAIAILQMLEKQMGPDPFRKVLQNIVNRPVDSTRSVMILSTKEFRHLANKVGNLERPFLKEFFPRWVESYGCPAMRVALSYNKRRNIIELAVIRGSTARSDPVSLGNLDNEIRESEIGWPGMMSVRVHELDGMYDHPILPLAGESCQLLEIQCHSKLAAKRIQKPKKGSKPDGSDDNTDAFLAQDTRNGVDSPLLWIRVDPEMEYLAEILCHQPVQMWINQLEKDKDVVAQSQAIAMLEKLPILPFTVINALNSFLSDSKAFWRVRIEAAYALARTHSEETDLAGLLHLVKFYKGRRYDADIGLPRPNDFRDVQEYFVLEAIPHAVALVRAANKNSPREAIEFVLQLLKYNDNNGNSYTDVYWLAALVESVGELEFGQQGVVFLSSLLKRIDRLMQFDSLLPSYNGILTMSCIRTLAQIALRMSNSLPFDRVCDLIKPFRNTQKTSWKVRIEASRVLLDLEYHSKGLDAALSLFVEFVKEESSLRGEVKLAVHIMHLCQLNTESYVDNQIASPTLVALLGLLASRKAFHNVLLRHYLFCILQILAGRSPTLYGAPKIQMPPASGTQIHSEQSIKSGPLKLKIPRPQEPLSNTAPNPSDTLHVVQTAKDVDTISTCSERKKNVIKIRVKQTASSSKVDDLHMDHSRGGPNDTEVGPCSSVSVDAPLRGVNEPLNISSQINEEVNSSRDRESRMSASIASGKPLNKDEIGKELQCTADSRQGTLTDRLSPAININVEGKVAENTASLQAPSIVRHDGEGVKPVNDGQEDKDKKDKDKDKKRKREDKKEKRDDPEYLERKRLKKEKKKKERELAKRQKSEKSPGLKHSLKPEMSKVTSTVMESKKLEYSGESHISKTVETSETTQGSSLPKVRIKFKSRSIGNA